MKLYVQSAKTASDYAYRDVIQHGNIKYFVYWNETPFEFSMSKLAGAYVEGDFAYAKYNGQGKWCTIYDGETYKPMDRITIPLWSEKSENYEDFNEYANDVFDRVLLNLEEYNKDVKTHVSNW